MTEKGTFWVGGVGSHLRELRSEMRKRLQPLEDQLKAEQDHEARAKLKAQIKEIRKEFAEKEKQSNYALFNRQ